MTDTAPKLLRDTTTTPQVPTEFPAHLVERFGAEADDPEDTPVLAGMGELMGMVANEVHTAPAFSTIEVSEPGVILKFGSMEFTAAKALELFTNAGIVAENPLPPMEEQVFGYKRAVSEQLLPIGELGTGMPLPVLAGIGEIKPLAGIKDPVVHRVFADEYRAGPRLLGVVAKGPGIPAAAQLSIAEFPPATILARIGDEYFQLKTPYVIAVYRPQYGDLHLRCRPRPMTTNDTQLYALPFPHIDAFGLVCMGQIDVKGLGTKEPLEAVVGAMTTYWHNGYKYYLGGKTMHSVLPKAAAANPPAYHQGDLGLLKKDFKAWEKLSYEEVLALKYQKTDKLMDYVTQVAGRRAGTEARWPVRWFLDEQAQQAADYAAVNPEN